MPLRTAEIAYLQRGAVINEQRDRKLVVAVDGEARALATLGSLIRRSGFNFMGTANGIECLNMSCRIMPRLLLLAVDLPEISGYELCRKLRANPDLTRVPVAFLTHETGIEGISEGLAAGGNDFIVKPIDPNLLIDRVEHWTRRLLG